MESQFRIYQEKIIELAKTREFQRQGKPNYLKIAKHLLGGKDQKQIDLLRTYARRICVKAIGKKAQETHPAKILLFDIETAPMTCFTFSKWPDSIGDDFIITDWYITCWSAKYLFEDKVVNMCMTPQETKTQDDLRVTKGLWKLFDEADIIVAHNLKKFDKKVANTRFLKHDLKRPSHYQEIDTLRTARSNFKISSNRLDYIAKDFLKIEGKQQTEKGLWQRCWNGEQEALDKMQEYCDQDVRVLEDVYLYLRPYITPHPNIGLFSETDSIACPRCGSEDVEQAGVYKTYVNEYTSLRCVSCGGLMRCKNSQIPQGSKSNMTRYL